MNTSQATHFNRFSKDNCVRSAVAAAVFATLGFSASTASAVPPSAPAVSTGGLIFKCSDAQLDQIHGDLSQYLDSIGVKPSWVDTSRRDGQLRYSLHTNPNDTDTLNLVHRAEYEIKPETVDLAKPGEEPMLRETVSRKEIVLALMQHGRRTVFDKAACNAQAFIDHVALRQNTVAWSQKLSWGWPEGGPAKWNERYWSRGTPVKLTETVDAMRDAFTNQAAYEIGCYTATKLAVVQGAVDYFARANPQPGKLAQVQALLTKDGDPLVSVEPGRMWHFETDVTAEDMAREGKLLTLLDNVAPLNFVPGDWSYFLNPDPVSYQKTGYEGSNAIYLGGGRFDDYYADTPQNSYRYKEKLAEVFQWRNGVYSRSRDWAKRQHLTPEDFDQMSLPPEHGGLVLAYRAVPKYFGYEGESATQ